ncbi:MULTISPECIES: HEAT repeat domain-containing protein [unclassified Solwaraspora]|uniref:HEAT repeat domain-containing protein n=1 Tax=unclassified Solwaraspora TaxID=2627926 RepID=UPI00248B5127|nr:MULTISPECIES: HEAT repeat domain-containing protein [unclassified Solwaraspora]WBB96100.1 HEAT repeat domain-containing protein [Solwaraspora sp. WMMA2059]WBC19995.1 HEAT repeat domain-containing protein [Solwaraspora sp. WMMA2080]WJK32408.1 HEAT repeat domain-containing protein [Solwaraspora sp. WMMA2065]
MTLQSVSATTGGAGSAPEWEHYLEGDPALLNSEFGDMLERGAVRLDARTDEQVEYEALHHRDPMIREQSLYQAMDRRLSGAVDLLAEAVANDSDRQVRWNALWALEKIGGTDALRVLDRHANDDDPDVGEWARLFGSELRTGLPSFDNRSFTYDSSRTFDETILLNIHCDVYVALDESGRNWGKITLSPQGLARSYGQAHACPNVDTRNQKLIISKTLDGLHEDGSPHTENFVFRGLTNHANAGRGSFYFESRGLRPVFLSGRADDDSLGHRNEMVAAKRSGEWTLDPNMLIKGEPAIRYVRGRVHTWGYLNFDTMRGSSLEDVLFPGNSILGTLDTPSGPLANAFIVGTFKGKLVDWNGDGAIDANSLDIYSTRDGDVDSDQDGVADIEGVQFCPRTNWMN